MVVQAVHLRPGPSPLPYPPGLSWQPGLGQLLPNPQHIAKVLPQAPHLQEPVQRQRRWRRLVLHMPKPTLLRPATRWRLHLCWRLLLHWRLHLRWRLLVLHLPRPRLQVAGAGDCTWCHRPLPSSPTCKQHKGCGGSQERVSNGGGQGGEPAGEEGQAGNELVDAGKGAGTSRCRQRIVRAAA